MLTYTEIQAIATELKIQLKAEDLTKPVYIVQNEAYRRFGRARVEKLVAKGKVRKNDIVTNGKITQIDLRLEDLEREVAKQEYRDGILGLPKQNKRK